jgi:hypothetical protein
MAGEYTTNMLHKCKCLPNHITCIIIVGVVITIIISLIKVHVHELDIKLIVVSLIIIIPCPFDGIPEFSDQFGGRRG